MKEIKNQTLQPSGTVSTQPAGNSVPGHYGDPSVEYSALKHGAALVGRDQHIMRLSGKDQIGMLNAILTNDVPKEEHRGAYATLLDPKGHVQADLRVLKYGEDVLVITEPEGAGAARAILGRYAPFSRVKVEDLVGTEAPWAILGLYGPHAAKLLGDRDLEEHETLVLNVGAASVLAVGVRHPVSGYDLICPADELPEVRKHLVESGATPTDVQAYEAIRIETGTPRFGPDITPENFPAEAGILERAVSFTKGCYPGQETVARMYYRGHPNRSLRRLVVEGGSPQPGVPIFQNDKRVGKITSVAPMPVDGKVLALGYLHRNTDSTEVLKAEDARVAPLTEI